MVFIRLVGIKYLKKQHDDYDDDNYFLVCQEAA